MTDRALFLGRFQPFHLGHLDVVQRLAREHAEVVVAIGSAQVSHTPSNPFTAGERLEMVHGKKVVQLQFKFNKTTRFGLTIKK